jgi:hypothetical protein
MPRWCSDLRPRANVPADQCSDIDIVLVDDDPMIYGRRQLAGSVRSAVADLYLLVEGTRGYPQADIIGRLSPWGRRRGTTVLDYLGSSFARHLQMLIAESSS